MKKLLLSFMLPFLCLAANAQIGEVKIDGSSAKIYDERGSYSGIFIGLSSGARVSGYNSKFVVITDGSQARIYDSRGTYTGGYVSLSAGCYVKNVTANAILVKEGSITRYYDFRGNYAGTYTND
jgi:hypothetical protein